MAIRYTIKRCPNCNKKVEFLNGHPSLLWGSPFKKCGHCGAPYIDPQYKEPALRTLDWYIERQPKTFDWLPSVLAWLSTLSTCFSAMFIVFDFFSPFLRDNRKDILIWFLASALIMVLSISAAKSISTKRTTIRIDKDFLKKYRESEKRLSNESYLNNLLGLDADNFSFFDNIK